MKKIFIPILLIFATAILFACTGNDIEKHTVSFIDNDSIWHVIQVENNKKIHIDNWPEEPQKDGHRFDGWHEGSRLFDLNNERITDDISLNSKYTLLGELSDPDYINVTFYDKDNKSMPSISKQIKKETAISEPGTSYTNISGYIFDGWYTNSSYSVSFDFSTLLTTDTNIYGKWDIIDENKEYVTVTFYDKDNKSMSSISKQIEKGTAIAQPSSSYTNISGYDFKGWYTNSSYSTVFNFSALLKADTDIYGKWTESQPLPYYDGINSSQTGTALLDSLRKLIRYDAPGYSSSTSRPVLSGDPSAVGKGADTLGTENVYLIYSLPGVDKLNSAVVDGKAGRTITGASVWNQEHVWPQALFDNEGDVHNLRACETKINGQRDSNKFRDGSGDRGNVSSSFYPGDGHQGDVARIIMYLLTNYSYTKISTIMATGSSDADKYAVILKWHKADPVDDFEIYRNQKIYEHQKNRNPFIDHPEYADAIWGSSAKNSRSFESIVKDYAQTMTICLKVKETEVYYA